MHASFCCIYCMLCIDRIYCHVYAHRWHVKCVYCIYFCLKFLNTLVLYWRHEFIRVSAWRSKCHSPQGPVRQLAERRGQSWGTARAPSRVSAEQRGHMLLPSKVFLPWLTQVGKIVLCTSLVCNLSQTYLQQSTFVPGLWVVPFGKEKKNKDFFENNLIWV